MQNTLTTVRVTAQVQWSPPRHTPSDRDAGAMAVEHFLLLEAALEELHGGRGVAQRGERRHPRAKAPHPPVFAVNRREQLSRVLTRGKGGRNYA